MFSKVDIQAIGNEVASERAMETDPPLQIVEGSSADEELQFDFERSENYNDNVQGRYWCDDVYTTEESSSLPFNLENVKNLRELIDHPEFNAKIDIPVDKSRGEIMLMVMKYSIHKELSVSAITNLYKLINTMFTRPILINSRYMLNKFFNAKEDFQYNIICYKCSADLGKERLKIITCPICKAVNDRTDQQKSASFILSDPSEQIVDLIESNQDHFHKVTQQRTHKPGYIYLMFMMG
ncbi:hypothetical protein TKK_0007699 [Trichogramma kaykai]